MITRGTSALVFMVAMALLLAAAVAAFAQPAAAPFGTSTPFDLDTNRIGFADSGVLSVSSVPGAPGLPDVVALGAPAPNPFNPRVTIPFSVGTPGPIELRIYDARGRLVRELANRVYPVGSFTRPWDGRDGRGAAMPAGVYLIRLRSRDVFDTRKVSLAK